MNSDDTKVDWKEYQDCTTKETAVCYHGTCGCSKSTTTNVRGDGTTIGTCGTDTDRCFSDGLCKGTFRNSTWFIIKI